MKSLSKTLVDRVTTILVLGVFLIATISSYVMAKTEITVATVNNPHMVVMQRLTKDFEKKNRNIKVKWVTLEENVLRQRLTTDITTKGGQFDVMTIGMYEAPIWGKKGWLKQLKMSKKYDVKDILPAMRKGLSYKGKLYAAPFYGESSMLMYRKDLAKKAGMKVPNKPTWSFIEKFAAKIHDPDNGVYGICLRGKPGWGDNMALITTVANSFGAQWFGMDWKPKLDSPEWKKAVTFYVNLLNKYGPPGSSANSFNEILALYNQGKCGMWVDATIAASLITNPEKSKVYNKVAFAHAPKQVTSKGSNWLWAWSLAIPASTKKSVAAKKFITWATSKSYIKLVAKQDGWGSVPTGTRKSTYANKKFRKAASFAKAELAAIRTANPNDSTLNPSPYVGVQFAAIPEFQSIGTGVGQQMTAALAGDISVEEALEKSQEIAEREMDKAGYYD